MLQDLTVSESIDINASIDKVWKGLTDPHIIKEYLYGTSTATDWMVDSAITFEGEYQGHKYLDKGIVRENIPAKLLSYSYWSGFSGLEDKPENYSVVTYTLSEKDNNTTAFTWTQKGFSSEEGYQQSKSGMTEFLKKVKEVIESK